MVNLYRNRDGDLFLFEFDMESLTLTMTFVDDDKAFYYRYGTNANNPDVIYFIDPSGGPFIQTGDDINRYINRYIELKDKKYIISEIKTNNKNSFIFKIKEL